MLTELKVIASINAVLKVGYERESGVTKHRLPVFGYEYVFLQLCNVSKCYACITRAKNK